MIEKTNISIIGLGYVGLPLAALSAIKGKKTIGFDTNKRVIETLKSGQCHIKDEILELSVQKALATGLFSVTNDAEDIRDSDAYLICVPTPINNAKEPDLTPLLTSIETIAPYLNKGDLVVVESTVFPGTCEQEVIPLIESLTSLKVGDQLHLAHCPERVNPGDVFWHSGNIPRVLGATTEQSAEIAANLYSSFLGGPVYRVNETKEALRPKFGLSSDGQLKVANAALGSITMMRSIRDAEAVKAMENTVRDVNIAFVNELAKISDVLELDVIDIIDGMATKPFGKGPFYPGIGVGGHCIAVDPEWLKAASKKAGYMPEIIQLSRETNNYMPSYAVSLLQDSLNEIGKPVKNTQIAILGVSYKRNVDDPRESPFYDVKKLLDNKGADLKVYDSWVCSENNVEDLKSALLGSTAVIIVTEHTDLIEEFNTLDLDAMGIKVIIDGRNCLDERLFKSSNIIYHGIGRRA